MKTTNDFYEDLSNQEIESFKVQNPPGCEKCGGSMSATRREKGYTWTCLNLDCNIRNLMRAV